MSFGGVLIMPTAYLRPRTHPFTYGSTAINAVRAKYFTPKAKYMRNAAHMAPKNGAAGKIVNGRFIGEADPDNDEKIAD